MTSSTASSSAGCSSSPRRSSLSRCWSPGSGCIRLGIAPDAEGVIRLGLWLVVSVIYVGLWLAFATLCSVLFRRAATSALAAIGVWIAISLFTAFLVTLVAGVLAPLPSDATTDQQLANDRMSETLSHLSPATLYQDATTVLLNPTQRATSVVGITPEQVDRAIPSTLSITQSVLLVVPQIVGLIALTIAIFAAAYIAFMRQEIRA